MASQISHIVYGEKVLKKFFSGRVVDEKKFYIGCVFPDIRYLGDISREITHPKDPTTEKLLAFSNDFEMGAYGHVLVDIRRDKVLQKLGIYELVPPNEISFFALKYIEDEITCPLYQDWEKIKGYLDNFLPEETNLVPLENVQKWHKMLQFYFSAPPNLDSLAKLAADLGINPQIIEAVKNNVLEIKEKPKVMQCIRDTYNLLLED